MAAAGAVMLASSAGIYAMPQTSVTNQFETGVVEISLDQYVEKNGKLVLSKGRTGMMPGQTVSRIPVIRNEGADCYIRLQADFSDPEFDAEFFGWGKNWFPAEDGYYYYTEELTGSAAAEAFQGFHVSADLDSRFAGENIALDVVCEAIQSANFTPDFKAKAPWGNVEILQNEKAVTLFQTESVEGLQVVYEGNSRQLFADPGDFFGSFAALMPGDSRKGTAKLVNQSEDTIDLYFRQEAHKSKILEQMDLQIACGGKIIYQGDMATDTGSVLLKKLKPGEVSELDFAIHMPKELNNAYTLQEDTIQWIFSTEAIKDTIGTPKGQRRSWSRVKTGDLPMVPYLAAAGGAMIGLAALFYVRERRRRID